MRLIPRGCFPSSSVLLLTKEPAHQHTQMHKDVKTAQACLQVIHFTAERSVKAIRLSALHRRPQ